MVGRPLYPKVHSSPQAFSLLELLCVIAIISLITAIAAPSLGKNHSLAGEGSKLIGLLDMARQRAISTNTLTAVVVVTDGDKRNRLFTVLEGKHTGTSVNWTQVHRWETLADGILADPGQGPLIAASNLALSQNLPTLDYQGTQIAPAQYSAVIFRPGGKVTMARSIPTIQLVEANWPSEGTLNYKGASPDGTPANYFKVSVLPTGRIKVDRPTQAL